MCRAVWRWLCVYSWCEINLFSVEPLGRRRDPRHLYSVFRELSLHGQHFPGIHVRVVGRAECLLQLFQLLGSEDSPAGKPRTHMGTCPQEAARPPPEQAWACRLHCAHPKGHPGVPGYHIGTISLWKVQKFGSNKTEFFSTFFLINKFHQLILTRPSLKAHTIVSLKCFRDCPAAS